MLHAPPTDDRLVLVLVSISELRAQVNDDLANATVITTPGFVDVGSNVGATSETDESTVLCPAALDGLNSIWWSYTPALPGDYFISLAGSDFDTILSVETGAGHPLTELDCNDDAVGTQSRIEISLSAGATYYSRVVGYDGASGNVAFSMGLLHDNLVGSIQIPGVAFTDTSSNVGASLKGFNLWLTNTKAAASSNVP